MVPLSQVACTSATNNLQQSPAPPVLPSVSSRLMPQSHSFRCSAFIPVVPATRPFCSFATTSCMSGSVGGSSGTGMGVTLMGSDHPMGGASMYNATLSAICDANVSRQDFVARFSANQYHPLSCCHASTNSPSVRLPLISDTVFKARKWRFAAKHAFTCRPRPCAAAWESIPFLRSIAQ
jgi:hypothetical protein